MNLRKPIQSKGPRRTQPIGIPNRRKSAAKAKLNNQTPINSLPDSPLTVPPRPPVPTEEIKTVAAVCCYFNPANFRTMRENYFVFARHMRDYEVDLYTIELEFESKACAGDADFHIPLGSPAWEDRGEIPRVQRRTGNRSLHVMWQKERLLNILISQIIDKYDAIAWIDCDVIFLNRNWLEDTRRALATTTWIQPWRTVLFADSNGELEGTRKSTAWYWQKQQSKYTDFSKSHPGFAWCARSSWLKKVGGLYHENITGGADTAMVKSVNGGHFYVDDYVNSDLFDSYTGWAERALDAGAHSFDYIPGDLIHLYHGSWSKRKYVERLQWLHNFDPKTDIEIDDSPHANGLWRWTEFALKYKKTLVKNIRDYFPSRDEDERKVSVV